MWDDDEEVTRVDLVAQLPMEEMQEWERDATTLREKMAAILSEEKDDE